MDAETFNQIKEKYGKDASWAIWDIHSSFLENYQKVEGRIKTDVVLVGWCPSGPIEKDFGNFHIDWCELSSGTKGNTNKLIDAFKGSKYEGAYMTDIIKYETIKEVNGEVDVEAANVKIILENHPEVEIKNVEIFKEELEFIGSKDPFIIAFGNDVYDKLNKYFPNANVCKVPAYFDRFRNNGEGEYREAVWKAIDSYLASGGNEAVKKEGNSVTYSPNVEKPEFSHNDTCTVHSDIEIRSANTKWARKPACLYPEEAEAFREVREVLRRDYGVDSRLREVRPFTNTDKPEKYIAIYLDDISHKNKQFCCIHIDYKKLNLISIQEAKVWKVDISSASEISSNGEIKRKLEGTLRNFGYYKKTS